MKEIAFTKSFSDRTYARECLWWWPRLCQWWAWAWSPGSWVRTHLHFKLYGRYLLHQPQFVQLLIWNCVLNHCFFTVWLFISSGKLKHFFTFFHYCKFVFKFLLCIIFITLHTFVIFYFYLLKLFCINGCLEWGRLCDWCVYCPPSKPNMAPSPIPGPLPHPPYLVNPHLSFSVMLIYQTNL